MSNKKIIAVVLVAFVGFLGMQARLNQAEISRQNAQARIANYQNSLQEGTLSPSELQRYKIDLMWAVHNRKAEINTLRYTKQMEGLSLENQKKLNMLRAELPALQARLQEVLAVME